MITSHGVRRRNSVKQNWSSSLQPAAALQYYRHTYVEDVLGRTGDNCVHHELVNTCAGVNKFYATLDYIEDLKEF